MWPKRPLLGTWHFVSGISRAPRRSASIKGSRALLSLLFPASRISEILRLWRHWIIFQTTSSLKAHCLHTPLKLPPSTVASCLRAATPPAAPPLESLPPFPSGNVSRLLGPAVTMSGGGGYHKFRCKYFYSHNCNEWVDFNGRSCMNCVVGGTSMGNPLSVF